MNHLDHVLLLHFLILRPLQHSTLKALVLVIHIPGPLMHLTCGEPCV